MNAFRVLEIENVHCLDIRTWGCEQFGDDFVVDSVCIEVEQHVNIELRRKCCGPEEVLQEVRGDVLAVV